MRIAFSKPTRDDAERQTLFSRFGSFGYEGLQLKHPQYSEYIDHPDRFVELWGTDAAGIASGLITAGRLDAAGIAELRRLFRFAQSVGSERIIFCHSQPRQGLTSTDIRGFAKILSELGKEAQQYGTSLSLHHHYNQPVMYRQDFETFFEAVDDQSVKLTVDTAHLVKSGINDIRGVIWDYRHVLDNVHIKDIADGEFKLLGQGTIDFTPVFSVLQEIGFAGWVCADEESGSDLLEAMEVCAQGITGAISQTS
ncbi:MAG: sugar phosphate isomerase/epimerase [Chloroflexi bacterium]|nr:sugar phosphate isomerase/epimerase [Chloroflexota bacterium]